jgi:hypothetical protein
MQRCKRRAQLQCAGPGRHILSCGDRAQNLDLSTIGFENSSGVAQKLVCF